MKKIRFLLPILTIGAIALPITSCAKTRIEGKVCLFNYADAAVVGIDGKDYWLTAEPTTTSKIKAHKLTNVCNLQDLYGGAGYNQSVLVCKKTLIDSNPKYLNQVKSNLQNNYAYVSDPNNTVNIINNINANLTSGKSETLTTDNTTTLTLINCNTKYVDTETDKASYKNFLTKVKEIDADVQLPSNITEFYKGFPSDLEKTTTGNIKIICPDGAPAVGLASLLNNKDSLVNPTSFEFIKPDDIMTRIGKDKPDLAILPSNLATVLYNNTQQYVWLSTITWGNLYLLSSQYTETITKSNIKQQLLGKNIGVLQLEKIPGAVLKIILKENNIEYVI